MKIMVMHWGRKNAGPRLTRELASALDKTPGVEVVLSYSTDSDSVEEYERLRLPSFAIKTYRSAIGLMFALMRSPLIALGLKRFVRENEVDILLTTMFNPLQIAVLSWFSGVPVVACVHDARSHEGDRGIYNRLLRSEVKRATACVVFSEAVGASLRERFKSVDVIRTVHGAFRPRGRGGRGALSGADSRPTVGMFGRLGEYQGVEVFCESVAQLHNVIPFDAHVVGAGSPVTEALVSKYPMVNWDLRWVPEGEADDIVGSFSVVALPYREASQSGVFALALGLGVPVVASPVGGLVDQVSGSGAGILADDVSVESFTRALRRMLEDDDLRADCADAASHAASEMSWDRTAADIVNSLRPGSANTAA